jgi:hypothetical protein
MVSVATKRFPDKKRDPAMIRECEKHYLPGDKIKVEIPLRTCYYYQNLSMDRSGLLEVPVYGVTIQTTRMNIMVERWLARVCAAGKTITDIDVPYGLLITS